MSGSRTVPAAAAEPGLVWQDRQASVRLAVSADARYCASMVLTAVALQGCCLTVRLVGCRMAAVLAMCRRPWCFLPYGAGKSTDNALELAAAEQLTVPTVCAPDAGLHGSAWTCIVLLCGLMSSVLTCRRAVWYGWADWMSMPALSGDEYCSA